MSISEWPSIDRGGRIQEVIPPIDRRPNSAGFRRSFKFSMNARHYSSTDLGFARAVDGTKELSQNVYPKKYPRIVRSGFTFTSNLEICRVHSVSEAQTHTRFEKAEKMCVNS